MTAFKKRNRLIYTCTGEAERKRWNSSYEKLPNVNYALLSVYKWVTLHAKRVIH